MTIHTELLNLWEMQTEYKSVAETLKRWPEEAAKPCPPLANGIATDAPF